MDNERKSGESQLDYAQRVSARKNAERRRQEDELRPDYLACLGEIAKQLAERLVPPLSDLVGQTDVSYPFSQEEEPSQVTTLALVEAKSNAGHVVRIEMHFTADIGPTAPSAEMAYDLRGTYTFRRPGEMAMQSMKDDLPVDSSDPGHPQVDVKRIQESIRYVASIQWVPGWVENA